jgi:hypothetical protein
MVSYLIKPYNEIIAYKITHFDVFVNNIILKQSATITTSFFDEQNTMRKQTVDVLEGQDYINWTNDDYILNWICVKYDLVLLKA